MNTKYFLPLRHNQPSRIPRARKTILTPCLMKIPWWVASHHVIFPHLELKRILEIPHSTIACSRASGSHRILPTLPSPPQPLPPPKYVISQLDRRFVQRYLQSRRRGLGVVSLVFLGAKFHAGSLGQGHMDDRCRQEDLKSHAHEQEAPGVGKGGI